MKTLFFLIPLFLLASAGCDDGRTPTPLGLEQQPSATTESLNFSEITATELTAVDVNVRELIDRGIAEGWTGMDIIIIGDQPPIIPYNKMLPSGETVYSPDLRTGNPDPLPPNVKELSGILTPEQAEELKKDRWAFLFKLMEEMMKEDE